MEWKWRGFILLFVALGIGATLLLAAPPPWVAGLTLFCLVIVALGYDGRHPSVARQVDSRMRSLDPGIELLVLLRVTHRPHGSQERVELTVGRDGTGSATRVHRPRHHSPPEDMKQVDVALGVEDVANVYRTLEQVSVWDLTDQKSSVRDGTIAEIALTDGTRSNAFSAHMPHDEHLALIKMLVDLVPLGGVSDRGLVRGGGGLPTRRGARRD